MTRLIIHRGKIVGATMINKTTDLAPLTKIIEQGVDIEPYREQIGDVNFDLRGIVDFKNNTVPKKPAFLI